MKPPRCDCHGGGEDWNRFTNLRKGQTRAAYGKRKSMSDVWRLYVCPIGKTCSRRYVCDLCVPQQ